jgi:two-component system nitrate/nitrite response regulator NarL
MGGLGIVLLIHVFLIGTQLCREGLAKALKNVAGTQVVGASAAGALPRVQLLRPDVVLVDSTSADMLGLVRMLAAYAPTAQVVALALPAQPPEVLACAEAGTAGYVTEQASLAELVLTIQAVSRGEMQCPAEITGSLLRRVAVLAADRHALRIELATVKNHVYHILEELQAGRRGDAAAYLRRYLRFGVSELAAGPVTHPAAGRLRGPGSSATPICRPYSPCWRSVSFVRMSWLREGSERNRAGADGCVPRGCASRHRDLCEHHQAPGRQRCRMRRARGQGASDEDSPRPAHLELLRWGGPVRARKQMRIAGSRMADVYCTFV